MAEHDFRRTALNPSHTLIECRTLGAGLFQVTGQGGGVRSGDELICTVKGSKDLPMRLTVDKIRYLINPPGQWTASARGPNLRGQSVLGWSITCDECGREQPFEFLAADRDDLRDTGDGEDLVAKIEFGEGTQLQRSCFTCGR